MSLKHTFDCLIPDDPAAVAAGEVVPSNWNEEHVFPGAGAGEVVYVDGAGHAATSADFTFDAGSKVLRVGGVAEISPASLSQGSLFLSSDIPGNGYLIFGGPDGAGILGNAGSEGDQVINLNAGNTLGWGLFISLNNLGSSTVLISPNGYTPATHELEVDGDIGAVTGYFGTSVVVGATPFTFSETAGVLQLGDEQILWDAGNRILSVDPVAQGGGFAAIYYYSADQAINLSLSGGDNEARFNMAAGGSLIVTDNAGGAICNADKYSVAGVPGFTGTITTSSLVGKTITITDGIITGFA